RQPLPRLELPAEERHRPVTDQRKTLRVARQLPIAPCQLVLDWCRCEQAITDGVQETASHVAQHEGGMAAERLVERHEASLAVHRLRCLDLLVEIGMRPERSLREGDEGAGQDV